MIVDNNAERIILLDEQGEILTEEQLTALLIFLGLKIFQPGDSSGPGDRATFYRGVSQGISWKGNPDQGQSPFIDGKDSAREAFSGFGRARVPIIPNLMRFFAW